MGGDDSADPFSQSTASLPADVEWACQVGLAVIPVRSQGKKQPWVKWSNHRHGSTPRAKALAWQRQFEDRGLLWAACTGDEHDLIILDFDVAEGGVQTFESFGLPPTVTTPSGGVHLWIRGAPLGVRTRGYSDKFAGMEVKANSAAGEPSKATFSGRRWRSSKGYKFHGPDAIVDWHDLPSAVQEYLTASDSGADRAAFAGGTAAPATPEWAASRLAQACEKVQAGTGRNEVGLWLAQRLWWQSQGDDAYLLHWMEKYQEAVTDAGTGSYGYDEITDTIRSVKEQKMREPERTARTKRPDGVEPLNDTGMAKRLVKQFGSEMRYCHPRKKWYVWNSRYWETDDTGAVMRFAKETARQLLLDAADTDDGEVRKTLTKAANQYASTTKLKHIVENAQSEDGVSILQTEMDPDPFLFCVENGVLDLRSGELRPHDPKLLITRMAPVAFDPSARDRRWSDFLTHVTGGNNDLERFLQRAAFASLVGVVEDKVFLYLFGPGNTGKTTFLELIAATWGRGYSGAVEGEAFLKRTFVGGMRSDLARTDGKRIVISNEMGDGQINEALLKKLTGGDVVVFEEKYVNPWENAPSFTIWMAGNEVPKALAESDALWDRWRQVPFTNKIPKADPKWLDHAKQDAALRSAVLAWVVRGRESWHRDGIGNSPVVQQATEELRRDMDPLRAFWEDHCLFGETLHVETGTLSHRYHDWCMFRDQRPMSEQNFGKLLRAKGCTPGQKKKDGKKYRTWQGIDVRQRK